jgi:hypothetical protein
MTLKTYRTQPTSRKRKHMRILALISAASICAAQPDYFPLRVGNQWVVLLVAGAGPLLGTVLVLDRVDRGD